MLTQLTPSGLPGQRYGSFAGKEAGEEPAGPHNPGTITQLAPYGLPGVRYSFVAKDASAEPEPPTDGLVGKGGRVRKKRFAVQIEGKWLSFESLDALEEYLEALREKELEKVEEQVERVVQKVLRTGKAPKKPAPRIQVKGPQEVKEMVDEINAHLDRIYWRKVAEELAARADEDDIEILALL